MARNFSCEMSGNLGNVGAAFPATGFYKKINWSKMKIGNKLRQHIEQDFFMCNVVGSFLDNTAEGFFSNLCNVVPRKLRQHFTGFFS